MSNFIERLFGWGKKPQGELPTKPLPKDQIAAVAPPVKLDPPQLLVGLGQSVGQQRDHNEDALFALTTTLTTDHSTMPLGLYIVADGMGGHQHGEVAAGVAVRSMAGYILKKLFLPLVSPKPAHPEQSLQEIMHEGVQEAQKAITRQAPGGGTTMTAVLILGAQMTISHVGDSRAYIVHEDGNLEGLTRDHSLVKRLVELGQLTTAEAAVHPQRNVLYRALGQAEPFEPDIRTMPLPVGSQVLICSDGLWGLVAEEEILRIIVTSKTPEQACQLMVDAANAAGGPDNITAILVRLPG